MREAIKIQSFILWPEEGTRASGRFKEPHNGMSLSTKGGVRAPKNVSFLSPL